MTTVEALEKIREVVYNRITRTCPYVSDEGILDIVSAGLYRVHEHNGTNPHDALVAAKNLLEWQRELPIGNANREQIDEVLAKINAALEDLNK